MVARFAEVIKTYESGETSLPEILRDNENIYVALLQMRIGIEQTGFLTTATIRAIRNFCEAEGIGDVCAEGPLSQAAAVALESVLRAENASDRLDQETAAASESMEPAVAGESKRFEARLKCGPSGRHPGFDRIYEVAFDGTDLSLTRGSRDENYFEEWNGLLSDNDLYIFGEYMEGEGGLKQIEFELTANGTLFQGDGSRGPRFCTVSFDIASHQVFGGNRSFV